MGKLMRPSPTESATLHPTGHIQRGNDGNMYTVVETSHGIKRWMKFVNPSFSSHLFGVGDIVRVVKNGHGVGPTAIGCVVKIIETGIYDNKGYSNKNGYKVDPPIGNSSSGSYGGFIGEETFEIVEFADHPPPVEDPIPVENPTLSPEEVKNIINKSLNMAKVKTITKRTAQEVRQIETSLINKEEVFKMLALAEATGLPLLLVGEPGVNSK